MADWTTTGTLALGCIVILYIGRQAFGTRPSFPLPPGPPGLPWVGNVIGINAAAPWITYAKWARTYGDIVYSRMLGKDIIIINSERIAKDLLEKRSSNYSDRTQSILYEMCGLAFLSVFLPYGDRWRLHRRLFHQTFRLEAIPRFVPVIHRKACHFLQRLLDTPEQLDDHVFEYTSSIILNSTYDYDPASRKDELVDIMANMLKAVIPVMRPDICIMVDAVPLLLHFPSWFPGMSFKKKVPMAYASSKQCLERPFEYSLQRVLNGDDAPSMVCDALQGTETRGTSPDESWMKTLKEASGSAIFGASETSHAIIMSFFLMMVVNPEVQGKAQAQIDAVVGNSKLPTAHDRPSLPLVDAIFWELLRYSTLAPLSIPHAATDDDVYNGYHIPKGAIIISNLWGMAHDESKYPNAHAFMPERFLTDDGSLKSNSIEHIAFGFGRRACVGRHFADVSVWGVIVKVLAVFKILKPLDENGMEIPVEPRFSSGIAVHPLPFGFRIVPRFPGMDAEKLEQLIAVSSA